MARPYIDYTGETLGYFKVLARLDNRNGKMYWRCQCRCGAIREVSSVNLGRQISCGCASRAALGVRNELRLKDETRSSSPEYRSWRSMIQRCHLDTAPNYRLYGGRGITVCEQWRGKSGFLQFYRDMGPRPMGTSLDRIDNDGHYEPGNCRWATAKEQRANQRNSPELHAMRVDNLNRGRARMWAEPELREKLLASRRK